MLAASFAIYAVDGTQLFPMKTALSTISPACSRLLATTESKMC